MKRNLLAILFTVGGLLTSCDDEYLEILRCLDKAYKIEYVSDGEYPEDYWQTFEETEKRKKGDCEDKAFYLHHLLKEKGIESEVVFGFLDDRERKFMHMWIECQKDGVTYILEPGSNSIFRKGSQDEHMYVPIYNNEYIKSALEEFQKRSGITG